MEVDLFALYGEENAGKPHKAGKKAGAGQITDRLCDLQAGLGKGGGPLADRKLGSAGHQHQKEKAVKEGVSHKCPPACLAFLGKRGDRYNGKQDSIHDRQDRPKEGQKPPHLLTKEGEKGGGDQDHGHHPPAIEGV